MRAVLIAAAAVLATAAVMADDKADRERRVRVALALAAAGEPDTPAADCGRCREDIPQARADALRAGKPLVLFVGGCPGREYSTAAEQAGAIPAKVGEYRDPDHADPRERRVVILEPKKDRTGFVRVDVPAGVSAAELERKVRESVPGSPASAKLDWSK